MGAALMTRQDFAAAPDLLAGYSLEISARDAARLESVRPLVPDGTLVSITSLPNETDAARIEAAAAVRRLDLTPMPHLAARRVRSERALSDLLEGLAGVSVDRLFVIAGDVDRPEGPYADALSLIEAVPFERYGVGRVSIAGYPEGHPVIEAAALDRARREKVRALEARGLEVELMTQFVFDADPILAWVRRVRADGFGGCIRVGLPGPASVGTLLRFAARCGVGVSARAMTRYGASLTRLLSTAGPDRLYAELTEAAAVETLGPMTIHLFPFGGLQKTAEWAALNAGEARR